MRVAVKDCGKTLQRSRILLVTKTKGNLLGMLEGELTFHNSPFHCAHYRTGKWLEASTVYIHMFFYTKHTEIFRPDNHEENLSMQLQVALKFSQLVNQPERGSVCPIGGEHQNHSRQKRESYLLHIDKTRN